MCVLLRRSNSRCGIETADKSSQPFLCLRINNRQANRFVVCGSSNARKDEHRDPEQHHKPFLFNVQNHDAMNDKHSVAMPMAVQTEPVKCCGIDDWYVLSNLRDGSFENLREAIMNEQELFLSDESLNRARSRMSAVFDSIESMTLYRERYLLRRIHTLERALGLRNDEEETVTDHTDLCVKYLTF